MSIPFQDLIPLKDLVKLLPPGPHGKARHVSCAYRFATRGVRGIKLHVVRLPSGLHSTAEWLSAFIEALTEGRGGPRSAPPQSSPRRANGHQKEVEAEIDRLRSTIRRRKGRVPDAGIRPCPRRPCAGPGR